MENAIPIEDRLKALHNYTSTVQRLSAADYAKLEESLALVESLIVKKRERRQAQVDIVFEDRRQHDRRRCLTCDGTAPFCADAVCKEVDG
jgi:hypothetical protein